MKARLWLAIFVGLALAGLSHTTPGAAQDWPTRAVKIVIPFGPGSTPDLVGRLIADRLQQKLGQPFVVEDKPGASGNIALEAVARALPDGYTLGFANTGNIVINPFLFSQMTFDPLTDLVPVGPIGTVPLFLVINSRLPAKTLPEFIAYAKAHPDTVNYAGSGAGTTPNLAGLEFIRRAGLKLVVIPFKGTTPATAAVVAGDVQATFISMGPHMDLVKSGALRVLAAATHEREPYMPNTPTFAELGFPGFETSTWFSLFAPRGTPPEIVDELNRYTRTVHQDADARRRLDANFVDPMIMSASEFAATVKADAVKWERIVRESGTKLE